MNPAMQHANVPTSVGTSTSSLPDNVVVGVPSSTMTQPTNNSNVFNINYVRNMQNSTNTTTTEQPTNAPGKRLIRKITPIDPKKLQQSGLDRKIAEALSKQKSQMNAAGKSRQTTVTTTSPNTFPSSSTPTSVIRSVHTTTTPSCSSSTVIKSAPTLQTPPPTAVTAKHTPTKIIIPPKITITGPEAPTELDKQNLVGLSPEQRLVHVKHLLNKKLLLKKNSNTSDTTPSKPNVIVHLKPPNPQQFILHINKPSTSAGFVPIKESVQAMTISKPVVETQNYPKLAVISDKPPKPSPTGFVQLKEQTIYTNKPINKIPRNESIITEKRPLQPPPTTISDFEHLKEPMQTMTTSKPVIGAQSNPNLSVMPDRPPKPGPTSLVQIKEHSPYTNKPVKKIPSYQMIPISNEKLPVQPHTPSPPTFPGFEHLKGPMQATSTSKPEVQMSSLQNKPIIAENPTTSTSFVQYKEINQTTTPDKTAANASCQQLCKIDDREQPLQDTPLNKSINKTPQKSPQDIARKLDFKTEDEVSKVIQFVRKNPTKFLYKDEKHSTHSLDIPKASLKPAQKVRQFVQRQQNVDFPEVSPLKTPFPTVNVPQETPLPTIDTFKKPYPMPPSNYNHMQAELHANNAPPMEYMTANYETLPTVATAQQLPNFNDLKQTSTSLVANATNSNCLIVLENKVLSQDEMIDLTALRLSTSKVGTPRGFAKPHRPIPEVVIKQEKPDDFPVTNTVSISNQMEHKQQPQTLVNNINAQKDPAVVERQLPAEMIILPAKQNKKIIINAQKLKLPPEKIAELAKKIAQSASSQLPSNAANRANKVETKTTNSDFHILNTKVAFKQNILPDAYKYEKEISTVKTGSNQVAVKQNSESYHNTYSNELQAQDMEKWQGTDVLRSKGVTSEPNEELDEQQSSKPTYRMYNSAQTLTTTDFRQLIYNPNNKNILTNTLISNDHIKRQQNVDKTNLQNPDISLYNTNVANTSTTREQIVKNEIANTSFIKSEFPKIQFVKMYKKDQEKLNVVVKEEDSKLPKYDSPPKETSYSLNENLQRSPVIKPLPPHGIKKATIKAEGTSNFSPASQSFASYSSFTGYRKPAVEIKDEPSELEDSFSAVDFLAAFANTNPITEETTLELSPEELNLNASCAMNLSPLRIASHATRKRYVSSSSSQKQVTKPETTPVSSSSPIFQSNYLPTEIGNIVNMQDNVMIDYDNSQTMSAIVIQSSKGPETIVTKTPENKCPILTIQGNKLKPVKIVNVLDSNKMGLPKLKDMEHIIKTTHASFKDSEISKPLNAKSNTDFEVSYKYFLDNPIKYKKPDVKVKRTRKTMSKKPVQETVKIPNKTGEISFQTPVNTTETSVKSLAQTAEKSTKSPDTEIFKQNSKDVEILPGNRPEPTVAPEFKSTIEKTETSVQTFENPLQSPVKTTEKSVKLPVKSPTKSILKQNSREGIEKLINTQIVNESCPVPTESQETDSRVKAKEKSVKSPVKTPIKSILKQNSQEDLEKYGNTEALNKKGPEPTVSQEFKSAMKTIETSGKSPIKSTEPPVKTTEKSVKSIVVKTPIKSILKQSSQEDIEKLINKETLNKMETTQSYEFKSTLEATEKCVEAQITATETHVKSPVKTPVKSILKQNFQKDKETLINSEITEKRTEPSESMLKHSPKKYIKNLNNTENTEKLFETTESQEFAVQKTLATKNLVKSPERSVSFESILKPSLPTTDHDKQTESIEVKATKSPLKSSVSTITNKYDIEKNLPTKTSVKSPENSFNIKSILKSTNNTDIQQSKIETSEVTTTSPDLISLKSKDLITAEDSSSKKSDEFKSLQDSEQSRLSESNSCNDNMPPKRISRFKKGKINLVQRNRKSVTSEKCSTGADKDKSKSQSSLDETKIPDTATTSIIKAATEEIDKVSKESGRILQNESQIIQTSNDDKSQNQVAIEVFNSLEEPQQQVLLTKDLGTSEIPKEVFNTVILNTNTTDCNNSSQINVGTSNTASPNLSPPDLNTTKKSNKESNIEIPTTNLQHLTTTEDLNKEIIEIQTTSENTNLTDSFDQTKEKDLTQSIGPGNEDEVLSADIKSSDTIETPPKNISQLLNPPKMPKRKLETKKIEELSPDSTQILEELKEAKVSLVDIVKHSPTEISQNPPQIPFKRKCTETPKTAEQPKGINTLLKLKKSIENEYNKELEKENETNKQDEENSANNTNAKDNSLELKICSEKPTTSENSTKPKRGKLPSIKADNSILEKKDESKQDVESNLNLHNSKVSSLKIQHKVSESQYESEISSEGPANSKKETKKKRGRPPSKIVDKSTLEKNEQNKQNEENTVQPHSKQLSATNIKSKFNDLFGSEKSSEEPSASETETKRKPGRPSLKKTDKSMEYTKKDEKYIKNNKHLSESELSEPLIIKRSARFSINSETPILPAKPINRKTRHSSRHQISDDDLELLPMSTETKELKLSNEKNKSKETNIESSPEKSTKRTRFSSKQKEMEETTSVDTSHEEKQLVKHPPSPVSTRTRFYSQASETDTTNRTRCSSKPTDPEDSCQDSPYDVNLSPTKQRKKLRKTLDDIKKSSQRPYLDTDSEDDDRDFDANEAINEHNEFLGFEENSEGSSKHSTQNKATEDDDNNSKIVSTTTATKGGTMKNWLTTGKAISPTFNKDPNVPRLRHDIKLSRGVPLKKRWDFAKNHHEETDITDDTSPADDEDDIETSLKRKRGLKNVIDSNKNMLDSKKIKLDETKVKQHTFREPRPVDKITKNSFTDADRSEVSLKGCEETDKTIENFTQDVATENLDKCNEVVDSTKVADNSKTKDESENASSCSKTSDCFNEIADIVDAPEKELLNPNTTILNNDNVETLDVPSAVISAVQFENDAEDELHKIDDSCSKETIYKANEPNQDDSSMISEKTSTIIESIPADLSTKEKPHKKQDSCHKISSETEENNNSAVALEEETKRSKFDKAQESSTKYKKSKVSKQQNEHEAAASITKPKKSKFSKEKKELTHIQEAITSTKSKNYSKENKTEDLEKTPESSKKHKISKGLKVKKNLSETPKKSDNNHLLELKEPATNEEFSKAVERFDDIKSCPLPPLSSTTKSELPSKRTLEIRDSNNECSPCIPKKRGRKPKAEINESSDEDCAPRISKKRGRKRKYQIEDSSDENTPLCDSSKQFSIPDNNSQPTTTPHLETLKNEDPNIVLSTPPSVNRRRRGDVTESNFNPRLLLIKKREQLENDDVLTEENEGSGDIQCGLCLKRTTAKKWTKHLAEHYGVGWQIGGEYLNVKNRSLVLSSIINYYKYTDIKGLNCRMCNKLYRSALGVLTHIEGCGAETVRVLCEYCNRDLAKASLNIHLRSCAERLKLENSLIEDVEDAEEQPQQDVFSNTGRLKRHSTIKAETKLKALGAILVEPHEFNPQDLMLFVPPMDSDEIHKKWSADIEEFGKGFCPKTVCRFNSPSIEELENHIKECKHINTGYFCKSCKTSRFDTETQAIEHINCNHKPRKAKKKNDSDSDCNLKTDDEASSDEENDFSEDVDEFELDENEVEDDDEDGDIVDSDREYAYSERRGSKKHSKSSGNSIIQVHKKVYGPRAYDLSKEVYIKWKKFLSLNYSSDPILPDVTSPYTIINNQDFAKYLPNQVSSMKFYMNKEVKLNKEIGFRETNVEWLELKRFEAMETKKSETFYFLGAPIKFVCWIPLPANVDEQYLVVGYRKEMFKFVKHSQPKQHTTVLMIFKVTLLNKVPKIEIHYGFTINDGPVHCVSFLPSGGYNISTNRLGLVAVGTVNAITKLYSLPIKVEIEECDKIENVAIIDLKPSFQLNLDVIDQGETEHIAMQPQCLNIQWSETSGHNLIFAGFSNGFIGIWDITDDYQENLNRFVVENMVNFAALNYFYIGEKCIKYFAIHYDSDGPRWLAVSAQYRKLQIYDIKNLMMPLILKEDFNKNILQCMDWCPLFGPLLTGYSDAIPNNGRCVNTISPVNITYTQQKLDYTCSGVTQIHYTPLCNMCVLTVDNGDIVFTDPREFHYEMPLGRKCEPCRRIVASMDIKQFDEQEIFKPPTKLQQAKLTSDHQFPIDWSLHEQDYKDKYGLVFNPFVKIKESNKTAYMNEKRRAPINITPFMRINSLRCNLNLNAKRLVAAGYENGFLRILYLNKEYIFSKS